MRSVRSHGVVQPLVEVGMLIVVASAVLLVMLPLIDAAFPLSRVRQRRYRRRQQCRQ